MLRLSPLGGRSIVCHCATLLATMCAHIPLALRIILTLAKRWALAARDPVHELGHFCPDQFHGFLAPTLLRSLRPQQA